MTSIEELLKEAEIRTSREDRSSRREYQRLIKRLVSLLVAEHERANTAEARVVESDEDKLRIFMNTNVKMSRGKYAAHAVHVALTALGVHPGVPVVVLGAKPRDIEAMRVSIHDAGHTELEPGTLTGGTNWPDPPAAIEGEGDKE